MIGRQQAPISGSGATREAHPVLTITLSDDHVAALAIALTNELQGDMGDWPPEAKRTFALMGDVLDMLTGTEPVHLDALTA
jgi:hypothetical protein